MTGDYDQGLEVIINEVLGEMQRNLARVYAGVTPQEYMLSLVPLAKDVVSCYRNVTPKNGELPAVLVNLSDVGKKKGVVRLSCKSENQGIDLRLGEIIGDLSNEQPTKPNVRYLGHAVLTPNLEYSTQRNIMIDATLDPKSERTIKVLRRCLTEIMGLTELGIYMPKKHVNHKEKVGLYWMKR